MEDRLPQEELLERDKKYVERIISDDNFAYYFFHNKCRKLFSKIQWTIFGNDTDYDELINSFYDYLKSPDKESGEFWHKLKTFDYRTSLFDWIKTVAVRYFYKPCYETVNLPDSIVSSEFFEEIISGLKSPEARKYFWYTYKSNLPKSEILSLLNVDNKQLALIRRRSETLLKQLIKRKYPAQYDLFFTKNTVSSINIDNEFDVPAELDTSLLATNNDVKSLVSQMPNARYREVITELFFNDVSPEELAHKMEMKVSNVYNIKARAIEQLRDILIYSPGEIELLPYINNISDDRLRYVADSIFLKHMEYDAIISQLCITSKEFKRLKLNAMKELKLLIFG